MDGSTADCLGCTIVAVLMGMLLWFSWDQADAVVKGVGMSVIAVLLVLGAWQKAVARIRWPHDGPDRHDCDGLH